MSVENEARPEPRLAVLERAGLYVAAGCCVLITILALLDIVLRALNVEFFIAGEGSGILLAWLIFLAIPATTRSGSHLSLTYFQEVAGPRLQKAVRIFGYLVMLAYVGVLLFYCGRMAWISYEDDLRSSSILRLPLIYAQFGVVLGLGLLMVTQFLVLLRDIATPAGQGAPGHGAGSR